MMILTGFFALGVLGACGWCFRLELRSWSNELSKQVEGGTAVRKPIPDAKKYAELSIELESRRKMFSARYAKARTSSERNAIEKEARALLEGTLPAMMRCWLGTPWDFHGTAEAPGKGKIACGYFVATVLKDAGFRVDRYKLAQQASENIMRSFVAKDACRLTVGQPYERFADGLSEFSPGIYIVGLDTHVAFLLVEKDGFRFIHSSGASPWCVVDEGRKEADVLRKSSWRMLGNFTGDSGVIRSWLKGGRIAVKGA